MHDTCNVVYIYGKLDFLSWLIYTEHDGAPHNHDVYVVKKERRSGHKTFQEKLYYELGSGEQIQLPDTTTVGP